ncbi:MAG: M48 family metallopeptidase [Bacteroidia bacterium]|nr:M48 family metallopeptidase [Bacteroidia bacterium]
MKKIVFVTGMIALLWVSCSRVPFTNRRQAKLLPESTMNSMSFTQYDAFLKENRLSTNKQQVDMVKRVGLKVQKAAEVYYKANGLEKELENFQWEFNLVQNDTTVNAWCMPGGKVVVYTGILPITKDENGLAVVMGHEIAHALANHGNERMSQQLAVQAGGVAIDVLMRDRPAETRNIFLQAYGVGATVGALLPFSRKHESEADEIGLYLMAIAGYDVNAASPFWERMGAKGGQAPPEFMSTHPSPETRAANLKAWAPAAIEMAKKYKVQ